MILRKKCLNGILLFYLIRRCLENFCILQKFRHDFWGFGLSRLMRGITTSRVSPLLVMTMKKNRLAMTDEKEVAGILGSCVASPRMTVEKGYCHLEPRAIARGCKDLINKCRDCIELTRLKQVRIKLKRDLYGDFACAQPLKMTMIICLVLSLGVAGEARAACNNGVDEENKPCGSWDCGAAGSNVTCTLSKGTLTISGTGDMKDYVHRIYQPWWNYRNNFTSVKVEEGVTKIGDRAFQDLTNVKNVSLPNTLTSIGEASFYGTSNLKGALVIPSKVTDVGGAAFWLSGITSLTLPDSLRNVGDNAFRSMISLQEMIIPDTLVIDENWGAEAFMYYQRAPIRCQGDVEKCKLAMKKFMVPPLGDCKNYIACFFSTFTPANESQCNTSASHYFTGTICDRRPTDGSDIVCDYETKGYVKYKNYCASPETSYAKKHYTPAEAAYWLNEDNNTVTLTFKK